MRDHTVPLPLAPTPPLVHPAFLPANEDASAKTQLTTPPCPPPIFHCTWHLQNCMDLLLPALTNAGVELQTVLDLAACPTISSCLTVGSD